MIPKVSEENEYSPRAGRRARNFFQVCAEHPVATPGTKSLQLRNSVEGDKEVTQVS